LKKIPEFRKVSKAKQVILITLIMALIIFSVGCSTVPSTSKTEATNKVVTSVKNESATSSAVKSTSDPKKVVSGQLKVHYIDVGQGDSILIQQGSQNMLIDTGTNASTKGLMSYLQTQNIKKIDILVLTHPHEDHIGGADAVINGFDIGTIYMPKITSTTKTFKDVVNAISSKGLKAKTPNPGETFKIGNAECTILSPINSNAKDLNTYSIVIKLAFGNNKFLFTGDTQASNEQDMLLKGYDLSADVLKVAHHGSYTSTTDAFLKAVNPKYAVISVGKGNDYKHPHQQIMDKLKAKNIAVYRTDENGTVIATSDGKTISFNTKVGDYAFGGAGKGESPEVSSNPKTPSSTVVATKPTVVTKAQTPTTAKAEQIVYYTPNGKSYHYNKNCSTLSRSKTILSGALSAVMKLGKTDPCDICVK